MRVARGLPFRPSAVLLEVGPGSEGDQQQNGSDGSGSYLHGGVVYSFLRRIQIPTPATVMASGANATIVQK